VEEGIAEARGLHKAELLLEVEPRDPARDDHLADIARKRPAQGPLETGLQSTEAGLGAKDASAQR
jgi:hypothetical protein